MDSKQRLATYTNLDHGDYVFRVQGSNSDGVWNEEGVSLPIVDHASLVEDQLVSRLVRGAVAGAPVGGVPAPDASGAARVRDDARGARRRAHADRPGASRHPASELPRAAAAVPDGVVPAAGAPGRGEGDAGGRDRAGGEGDHRRSGRGAGPAGLGRRAQRSRGRPSATLGDELADGRQRRTGRPRFRVAVEGQARDLQPIVRDEIYKIAAEALRNAFRHAQAGQVEVEIRYDDKEFRLRVRDDGKGIDPAVLASQGIEGHYGLRGMPERAALMGGKLAVWSEVGAGTEVELRLPAGAAYAASRRPSWLSRLFASRTPARSRGDVS